MKCKGRIIFSGELFKLDLQSEEKVNAAPNLLSEKVIDVRTNKLITEITHKEIDVCPNLIRVDSDTFLKY